MKRKIRRTALLNIQRVSYSRDHVARVRSEGFTDIGVSLKTGERKFTGQGFDSEQVCQFGAWADEFGLGMTVFTGYMKYRESFLRDHPERAMVCVGGSGTAMDSDNLVRTKWLCPFQPENKVEYLDLLRKVIGLPALREIHLNDEAAIGFANGDIGCYCDHCVSEYEREYGSPPPADFDWESDAWWDWVQRRMARWTEVHAWFRAQIKAERPDVMVGIQYSPVVVSFNENTWRAGIDLSRDALAQDVLCTDPYHYNHTSHFTYRPARRILTEATRTLAGATVRRSMNIYPQAFRPPLGGPELTRRDGFMAGAVPYALGADNITPYSNDLARIIPGFLDGFHEAGKLIPYFEKTRPYAYATVVNPTQTEIYGNPETGWGRKALAVWPDVMNHVGLPWRWHFDGRLADAGNLLEGPAILPDTHCLTGEQRAVLQAHAASGNGLLRVGRTPGRDWPGNGPCPPPEGKSIDSAEMRPVSPDHPFLEGVSHPVMLQSAFSEPGIEGETVGEIDGRPALVLNEEDDGRQVWLAGVPEFSYVTPGDHGGVRTPTDGIPLLRNILKWLARDEPVARLAPYPPDNAYRDLRPWDRRDVPTMELFPMIGDGCLVCLIFNYVGLEYRTNLVMRAPEGAEVVSLVDVFSGDDRLPASEVRGSEVFLPVRMSNDTDFLAVEMSWD